MREGEGKKWKGWRDGKESAGYNMSRTEVWQSGKGKKETGRKQKT